MIKFFNVLIDVVLVSTAELLAFLIRFGYPLPPAELNHYYANCFFIILIRIWALYSVNAYSEKLKSFFLLSNSIFKACIFSTIIITAITFFNRTLGYPRSVILISFLNILTFLLIKHYIFWKNYIVKKNRKRILIIGATEAGKSIIKENHLLKYGKLVGFIDEKMKIGKKIINNLQILGRLKDLKTIIKKGNVNLVVIAIPDENIEKKLKALTQCEEERIEYIIIPSFYEIVTGRARLDELDDLAILEPSLESINMLNKIIKRGFDIIFSFIILVLSSPFLILIGLIIKTNSKGPMLYKQLRAGKHGKPFYIYKFRTMVINADRIGPRLTTKNDIRVTNIGKFLRRWSLDEFPQFFNVLKGDMSVAGPRPEIVELAKKYKVWQQKVLDVKPGITGYAQISGRQELDIELKLKMDLYYINNYSFLLDIEIIFKTIITVFSGKGVF